MDEKEAKKIENKLVSTSLIFTVFMAVLLLLIAYFLQSVLDWRLPVGLAIISLAIQFFVVGPGIQKTCRNLTNEKKSKN